MDPRIAQMIGDATTVVDGALAAGYALATDSVYLMTDPSQYYKGVWFRELDRLGLYLPLEGSTGPFLLVANPGLGAESSKEFVVTREGTLCVAGFSGDQLILAAVDDATTTWLAGHIHNALAFLPGA